MFKILSKRILAPNITEMRVEAPRVARAARPGQFVIVRVDEVAERIPLTICDYDADEGWVTIVTQAVGHSSSRINELNEGDSFADFTGPLGRPSELVELSDEELAAKRVLFVAGGVGTAPVYPQAKWLHDHGVRCDVIIGAKTSSIFTYVNEMREVADVHLCTDDGSEGFHGMVTALMTELIEKEGRKFDLAVIIGPMIMMKFAAREATRLGIPCVVSLNALMVDGTGMCGACRVTVDGQTRFTCVDGPEFDGALVDFDEAMRRQNIYREHPKTHLENHKCNCHG